MRSKTCLKFGLLLNKQLFYLIIVTIPFVGWSQEKIVSTNEFTISGLVKKELRVSFEELEKLPLQNIGDLKIVNHEGEFRRDYKELKGVLLTDILKNIEISVSAPRYLSECYIIMKATDGYSVVFSWNELFNTEIGLNVYVVMEANRKSLKNSTEKMLLVSSKDFKTGRRHVKGLKSIEIKRI